MQPTAGPAFVTGAYRGRFGRTRQVKIFDKLGSWVPRAPRDGGARADVVGPPPGELFSETNDNSVAVLLTYGTARILLVGDAEAREEYVAGDSYI